MTEKIINNDKNLNIMYTLNDEQIASLEAFIGKLDDSLIKSKIEKWFAEVEPTRRCDSDKMERFVEMSVHLPVGLQYYPISFANTVKNTPETERREASGEVTETANLIDTVNESIEDVPDVDAPDDEEETEQKLGKTSKTQSKGKAKSAKKK